MAQMKTWYNDATTHFRITRTENHVANRTKLECEYLATHANLVAMISNLTEFVNSMPAPDDNNEIPKAINWAVLGDYKRIEAALAEVSSVADEVGK